MKTVFIAAIAVTLSSCATMTQTKEQPRKLTWYNADLYSQLDTGGITEHELDHIYSVSNANCEIESLKIPIPSPSCTQPPKRDCTGMTGFSLGFCQSYRPAQQCNYSATNAAKESQWRVRQSCMALAGWTAEWE